MNLIISALGAVLPSLPFPSQLSIDCPTVTVTSHASVWWALLLAIAAVDDSRYCSDHLVAMAAATAAATALDAVPYHQPVGTGQRFIYM